MELIVVLIILGICAYIRMCVKASKRFPPQLVKDFNQRYMKGFYNVKE